MAYGNGGEKGGMRNPGGSGYRLGNDGSTVSAPRGKEATVKDNLGGNAAASAADDRKEVKSR